MIIRKLYFFPLLLLLLLGCGDYKHFQPSPNMSVFSQEGEFQVSGEIGSSGTTAKATYAFPGRVGVAAMYHGGLDDYHVQEGEIGVGYYKLADPVGFFAMGGLGFGKNYGTNGNFREYEGSYLKPFAQITGGIGSRPLLKSLRGDILYCLKTTYFMYDGIRNQDNGLIVQSDYIIIEPGLKFSLGAKVFRFDLSTSYPLVPVTEKMHENTNARTFPVTISFGVRLLLGSS